MLYVPSAHPGCLAPHLWLADGSSLYDHFGPGFTLLVTEGDERAGRSARKGRDEEQHTAQSTGPDECAIAPAI